MTALIRILAVAALVAIVHARVVIAQAGPVPVWIDTDPAVGVADRDVDDGFALLQAFHSPEIAVRGVSVVFGNAPLAQAWPIGLRIVGRFGPPSVRAYRGAAKASELGVETAATRALAASLRREPLVVLVLGPATNVATVLKNHPELRRSNRAHRGRRRATAGAALYHRHDEPEGPPRLQLRRGSRSVSGAAGVGRSADACAVRDLVEGVAPIARARCDRR